MPGKLTAQVEMAVVGGFDTVVTGILVEYQGKESVRVPTQEDVTLKELVRRRVMEAHPSTVLVRREALVGVIGEVDEQIPGSYAEDYDWILRAAKSGPIGVVSDRWFGSIGASPSSPSAGRRSSPPWTTCSRSTRSSPQALRALPESRANAPSHWLHWANKRKRSRSPGRRWG